MNLDEIIFQPPQFWNSGRWKMIDDLVITKRIMYTFSFGIK